MAGPTAPLTKAFVFCGWECLPVDWLIDSSHDLSSPARQSSLHAQLQDVDCICAAMDCSTKSRAREIPRHFDDGRPAPRPLRSIEYPEGLPDLTQAEQSRVDTDNKACQFVLDEIQQLAERGGISVRENPWRSLHWYLPQEQQMMDSGIWMDKRYSACCLMGARAKSQCLRHNVPEIQEWPVLDCHHSHDPREWDPRVEDGKRIYPSHEEATYTATLSFAVAVACSWWAVRTGKATLHVPRMPTFSCQGRKEHWLALDPRSLREWLMTPLAITLGLSPVDPGEASRVPERGTIEQWLKDDKTLPDKCIYVGRGHHSHRLPTTQWKSPFVPGHDCSDEEWIAKYVEHVCTCPELWAALPSLCDKILVCDCPWQSLCEADLLAGLVFEATAPAPSPLHSGSHKRRRSQSAKELVTAVATSRIVQVSSCPVPPQPFSQEAIRLAFQKLFPEPWLSKTPFPLVEDLVNAPPFSCYSEWRHQQGWEWDGPLNPMMAYTPVRMALRTAEGKQAGAISQKAALPPLLPFGLEPDDHFHRACRRARSPLPTESPPVLDSDLLFAGYCHATWRGDLRTKREAAMGVLRELQSRMAPITKVLRTHQTQAIRQVTAGRDLGMLTLLTLLTSWGDTSYPFSLIKGLPAVGYAPPYSIFPEQPAVKLAMEDVLDGWQTHNANLLSTLRAGKDDDFLLTQSTQDAEQGFCTHPMTRAEFLKFIKNQPHRLIPRCVITQSSGKQRVIDNADHGGQSALSSDANKLVLCSPLRVAQHIVATHQYMDASSISQAQQSDTWETGGEDWPNAYRHSPMSFEESLGCVVTWFHKDLQEPAYQLYTGLLFGLPLAVTSFNRYSRLAEMLARRLLFVLASFYFDDALISDWSSSKGSGQSAMANINKLLGTPFAEEKRQQMSSKGLFLGLDHDVSKALNPGFVTFWARERLETKLTSIINSCQVQNKLPPGVASKIYGIANFLEQGIYGRIGCGGLHAIKERQYEKATYLTASIQACFSVLLAVLASKPYRVFPVLPQPCERFCIASDAALEVPQAGTGGLLAVWFEADYDQREAFVADIPSTIYQLWTPGEKKIAQLELLMVLFGLLARPHKFRNRRGIWFIDNTAALMALIKGRSDSPDLEAMSHLIHMALYALKCWIYWEWIPSKSNWSDAVSRLGFADPWFKSKGFAPYLAHFEPALLSLPFPSIIRIFEFM